MCNSADFKEIIIDIKNAKDNFVAPYKITQSDRKQRNTIEPEDGCKSFKRFK